MTAPTPDIYGQVHPDETPELIQSSLKNLDAELKKLPSEDLKGWEAANEKCPKLVEDDHKLMFLRTEVFNADLAAGRLTKYWNKRIEVFGDEKAFLPLTFSAALADDEVAAQCGYVQYTGKTDTFGRGIIFIDPSRQDRDKYTRESMLRATWYAIHVTLSLSEESQQKGLVFIGWPEKAKHKQFDRTMTSMIVGSIRGILPVRCSGLHICHPPSMFKLIFPIIKVLLGARLRKRLRLHSGEREDVVKSLNEYGLERSAVPSEVGGDAILDCKSWVLERKASGL